MKKLKPQERHAWVRDHYLTLHRNLTCTVGEWNRDRLLKELRLYLARQEKAIITPK